MSFDENITRAMCVDLVRAVHGSMDWDIWSKKRLTYWSIFGDNIAAAAYTSSLAKWLSNICNTMSVRSVGRTDNERLAVEQLINSGNDKAVLRSLREETSIVILILRNEIDTTKNRKDSIQSDLLQ